ncbi:MAG TPA: A24 family peptidase [Gammaproteobacteria bacterium]|jgi:leader peptidase (prepilin peptidase)/N-methyltransferase|nr:A24 family peptidase [Gammaproteobacteria bacterium]
METLQFLNDYPLFFLIVTAVLSLFIGSFLNVVIYRLPRMMEQSWSEECRIYLGLKPHTDIERFNLTLPFSHCPHCKKTIRPWHNIPIVSFLWLRGKCGYCSAPISMRYPLVEALTCLMSVYVAWRFGFSWQTFAGLVFTWILISLTFIDIDYHLLPDQLTLLLVWTGLFFSLFYLFNDSHDAIIGAIAGYMLFALTQFFFGWATGKIGMGQGDYKFLAGLGAFCGWQLLPLVILLASISGIIFTFIHMLIKREFKSVPLPFGPYLAVAGWLALLWGHEIMQYYISNIY